MPWAERQGPRYPQTMLCASSRVGILWHTLLQRKKVVEVYSLDRCVERLQGRFTSIHYSDVEPRLVARAQHRGADAGYVAKEFECSEERYGKEPSRIEIQPRGCMWWGCLWAWGTPHV